MEKSNYYHFSSTPAEEAKKYRPKPLSAEKAKQLFDDTKKKSTGASVWNTGVTHENKIKTQQMKERLSEIITNIKFKNSNIKIFKIELGDDSSADWIWSTSRRKWRYGFEIHSIKCQYGPNKNNKYGIIKLIEGQEIDIYDRDEDWQFKVKLCYIL